MDPVTQVLVQYGAVGVIALVALGVARALFLRMEADHDEEIARAVAREAAATARGDRLEAELSRLNGAVQSGYVDTIVRANAAIGDAARAVADAAAMVRRS
jgi:hypothetical protein